MKIVHRPVLLFLIAAIITGSCQKQLYWNVNATGTLKNTEGVCIPAGVYGNYYKDVAPGDTNFIEVSVNVFTPGNYSIFSDVQNGLQFLASGSFTSTGLNVIKLRPRGIPLATTPSTYTICFDTSCCPLSIAVKDSLEAITPLNAWQYTDTKKKITYQGSITATYFLVTPLAGLLSLRMEATSANDTSFEIGLVFPEKVIGTGIFRTDTLNAIALSRNGVCVNCAWEVMYKFYGVLTTIVVTDFDPVTKTIKGTFGGTTVDANNEITPISRGAFKAIIK